MPSRLKALGLVMAAALALGAMAAAPASAEPFEFHFEEENTQLTASIHVGEDIFGFDAGLLECTEVSYKGAVFGSKTEVIPLTPTYTACTAFGFNATVDMNACFYVLKAEQLEGANYEGSFAIACPGTQIEVTMSGCTVTIGPQMGLKKVTYANVGMGANRSVTVTLNLSGIAYEEHKKGLTPTCTNPGKATNNGTFTGTILVKGEPFGEPEPGPSGVWVE